VIGKVMLCVNNEKNFASSYSNSRMYKVKISKNCFDTEGTEKGKGARKELERS
jgi:hypothetical protein